MIANIKNACSTMRNNLLGGILFMVFLFFLTGIANAIFGGFFTVCGIAIKDSSLSIIQKIVNIYYISAAKFELTDIALFPWLASVEFFICFIWYSHLQTSYRVSTMKQILEEIQELEKDIDQSDSSASQQKNENDVNSLKERIKDLKRRIRKRLPIVKTLKWISLVLVLFASITMLFDFSSTIVSFGMVKRFHRSVVAIRPFISDSEYHHLNRKWVTMKSRDDFKAIKQQISEYLRRIENDQRENNNQAVRYCRLIDNLR